MFSPSFSLFLLLPLLTYLLVARARCMKTAESPLPFPNLPLYPPFPDIQFNRGKHHQSGFCGWSTPPSLAFNSYVPPLQRAFLLFLLCCSSHAPFPPQLLWEFSGNAGTCVCVNFPSWSVLEDCNDTQPKERDTHVYTCSNDDAERSTSDTYTCRGSTQRFPFFPSFPSPLSSGSVAGERVCVGAEVCFVFCFLFFSSS
jgi:hypothetical protein